MTRFITILLFSLIAGVLYPCRANTRAAVKTNLLYDALLSPDLGVELAVSKQWSVELSGNYNGWKLSHNRQWKHWFLQPEARYWLKNTFKGHFLAANLIGGQFNTTLNGARRQGWAAGVGVGYGHIWRFGSHWGIEAELTAGYARYHYDKFPCSQCGRKLATRDKNYFGPTRAAVNVVYYFGRTRKPHPVIVASEPVVEPVTEVIEPVAADTVPTFDFLLVDVPHSRVLSQSLSGVAKVRFAVNRTEIDPTLGDNAAELNAIIARLDSVRDDLAMTVTAVSFTGYASPEGSWRNNDRLASGRTAALKDMVMASRQLPDSVVTLGYVAEDWGGLRKAVNASDLADREALLAIIDSDREPDAREAALRRHRDSWSWIVAEVLPSLRRTEYRIDYEHRYEEQETRTLEEVNRAITSGDIDAAARLLVDIPSSPEADYARGVVAALQRRYDEAEAWFRRAQSRGIAAASDALGQLKAKRGR